MKVTSNNLELYDTESFICLDLGETEVVLGEGKESLIIIFDFQVNSEIKEEQLEIKPENSTTLRIVLTNWNSPIGSTLSHPLTGGELFGRELSLIFSVKKIGSKGEFRELKISAYLGREVTRGAN